MDRLTTLYDYYNADKGSKVDNYGHHFGEFYKPFFSKFLDRKINLLEIGIQCGPSILAHNDYFYHNVELYGIDIDYSLLQFNPDIYDNIHLIQGDSTNPETLNELGDTMFDIIIDDASHIHEDMVKNLYNLHKRLTPDGIYILEDIHCDYSNSYNNTGENIVNMLLTHTPSHVLTSEQNEELFNNIKKVHIYKYVNDSSVVRTNPAAALSISSIIEFK